MMTWSCSSLVSSSWGCMALTSWRSRVAPILAPRAARYGVSAIDNATTCVPKWAGVWARVSALPTVGVLAPRAARYGVSAIDSATTSASKWAGVWALVSALPTAGVWLLDA
eukprot:931079-Pelagomonas_calceolata.AAC.1